LKTEKAIRSWVPSSLRAVDSKPKKTIKNNLDIALFRKLPGLYSLIVLELKAYT